MRNIPRPQTLQILSLIICPICSDDHHDDQGVPGGGGGGTLLGRPSMLGTLARGSPIFVNALK